MEEGKLSYNEAMQEVEKILASMERENPDIDDLSKDVKRAVELLQECKRKLFETDEEIKKVFDDLNNK
jgi:exodeoxyribonuclease VII small subunit